MESLEVKIRTVEKSALVTEVGLAFFVTAAQMVLKVGIATVALVGGVLLVGGERQRISIARAFLKNSPIILLDEATASLDVDNETVIQESLSRLIKDKTVLIIAHRMRTIANADKIVVLKDGIVAEQGAPIELVKKNGIYKHMTDIQIKAAEWKM